MCDCFFWLLLIFGENTAVSKARGVKQALFLLPMTVSDLQISLHEDWLYGNKVCKKGGKQLPVSYLCNKPCFPPLQMLMTCTSCPSLWRTWSLTAFRWPEAWSSSPPERWALHWGFFTVEGQESEVKSCLHCSDTFLGRGTKGRAVFLLAL